MSKKKLATVAVLASLVAGGGVYGGLKLLKTDWEDRKAEFAEALSAKFMTGGAPSKQVADKAAACVAEALVPVADAQKCSAEGENVLNAMAQCLNSNYEARIAFLLALPACLIGEIRLNNEVINGKGSRNIRHSYLPRIS